MENIERLRTVMAQQGLDGYLIQKKANVRYISNFKGDDSTLFVTKDEQFILTDPRYIEQAMLECPAFTIIDWRAGGHGHSLQQIIAAAHLEKIGFEGDEVVVAEYQKLQQAITAELVSHSGLIEGLRQIKTATEIGYLRNACEISCRAFKRLLPEIRVGVTEKELAAKLATYMVLEGADTQPYGNILISGKRTSLLHGIPSGKALEYGDLVLMDFGCQFKGYLSDMTRTVVVGKATQEQKNVYKLEKEMLETCEAKMRAGVKAADIYRASIEVVKESQYVDYTYSNIGHGIGLFVHEQPMLTEKSDETLSAGNVITIEPGIYIPGWGGIRIEDQVLVTEEGIENLISIPHELIEL